MRFVEKSNSDNLILSLEMQKGVFIKYQEGETVTSFILRVLSMDREAMNKEIQTLILNNGCVDEPEARQLVSGDTLVLSGAMPGLVGAMLRSNSPIKAMRSHITEKSAPRDSNVPQGLIKLKLFNTVLTDHREDLLKWGFFIQED